MSVVDSLVESLCENCSHFANTKKDGFCFRCLPCLSQETTGGISFAEHGENGLSHVIYQPCNLKELPSAATEESFSRVIKTGKMCLTVMSDDENMQKEYILFPEKRASLKKSYWLISGLQSSRQFIADKTNLFFHLKYNSKKKAVEGFDFTSLEDADKSDRMVEDDSLDPFIKESNILIGMLIRKAPNIGEGCDAKNTTKLHLRFEFYVDRNLWFSLSDKEKYQLKYLQQITECWFDGFISKKARKTAPSPLQQASPLNTRHRQPLAILTPTRDCFKMKLIPQTTEMIGNNSRKFTKTVWYLPSDSIPENYASCTQRISFTKLKFEDRELDCLPVGMTTYNGLFSEEELKVIENHADEIDGLARQGHFEKEKVPLTCQSTHRGAKLTRTKFFFGARYLWHATQMKDKTEVHKAEGIRADVATIPPWMKDLVEEPLIGSGVVKSGFINSFAMNIYHDGTEGIKQHFDDSKRFARPIYSLRLFSPSRLSFGATGFSMSNALFYVPLPRGCVAVMGPGYAADGIKHCVRSVDMCEKSASVLLRRIFPRLLCEAKQLQQESDVVDEKEEKYDSPDHSPLSSVLGEGKMMTRSGTILGLQKEGNNIDNSHSHSHSHSQEEAEDTEALNNKKAKRTADNSNYYTMRPSKHSKVKVSKEQTEEDEVDADQPARPVQVVYQKYTEDKGEKEDGQMIEVKEETTNHAVNYESDGESSDDCQIVGVKSNLTTASSPINRNQGGATYYKGHPSYPSQYPYPSPYYINPYQLSSKDLSKSSDQVVGVNRSPPKGTMEILHKIFQHQVAQYQLQMQLYYQLSSSGMYIPSSYCTPYPPYCAPSSHVTYPYNSSAHPTMTHPYSNHFPVGCFPTSDVTTTAKTNHGSTSPAE